MRNIIIILATLLFCANEAGAQTIHQDTVNNLSYVNITPVLWQYSQPNCDRMYLTSYTGNMSTSANVEIQLGYQMAPDTWAHFVLPSVSYTFIGAQYDSIKTYGKPYIFSTIARINRLTIIN